MTSRHKRIVGLTLTAFVLCYASVAAALIHEWSTNYVYSYGFAVPLISAYVAWLRWPRVRESTIAPDHRSGVLLTIVGISVFVAGGVGALLAVQQLSLLVTLCGLVLLFLGRRGLRALAFPILYLLLAIPIWNYPISLFQEPSQTLSARIALPILHSIGVPALRAGTHLVLPSVTLEIMRECSGVNQLIAIIAMTVPAAVLWLKSNARRGLLIVMAIFTAYLSNGVRIALIGVLAYTNVNGAHSQGPLHVLQGLVISSLGYVLIGACLSVLSRTEKRVELSAAASPVGGRFSDRRGLPWQEAAVSTALILAAAYTAMFRPIEVHLRQDLRALPTVIGDWTLDPTKTGKFKIAGVDDELSRIYRNPEGNVLELYIGYHRYQVEGKEFGSEANRAAHAAATTLVTSQLGSIRDSSLDGSEPEGTTWFDVNGRVFPNVYVARAFTVWDAITTRRTNAAVIVVRWNWDARVQSRDEGEKQFVRDLSALLREYLPVTDSNEQDAQLHNARVSP